MTGATLKQKLLAVPDDVSSPRFIVGVRVARSLVVCVLFYRSLFVFLLAIVLSFFNLRLLMTSLVSPNISINLTLLMWILSELNFREP